MRQQEGISLGNYWSIQLLVRREVIPLRPRIALIGTEQYAIQIQRDKFKYPITNQKNAFKARHHCYVRQKDKRRPTFFNKARNDGLVCEGVGRWHVNAF